MKPDVRRRSPVESERSISMRRRVWREVLSWFWVVVVFVLLEGTMAQARMIPSGSMERTILVGDHLIVSVAGYDAGIPFSKFHTPLWREPHRQQIIVFRSVEPNSPDLIKRVIGLPGDRIKIVRGKVFVDGSALDEPYAVHDADATETPAENFPPSLANYSVDPHSTSGWAAEMPRHIVNSELVVPAGEYFMMGDNRDDSNDSRFWGFAPRANIIGTPVLIYMSIDAPEGVWESGRPAERLHAYLHAAVHPGDVRWDRLLHRF